MKTLFIIEIRFNLSLWKWEKNICNFVNVLHFFLTIRLKVIHSFHRRKITLQLALVIWGFIIRGFIFVPKIYYLRVSSQSFADFIHFAAKTKVFGEKMCSLVIHGFGIYGTFQECTHANNKGHLHFLFSKCNITSRFHDRRYDFKNHDFHP